MRSLPMRQIHLDFHTSPYIEGLGAAFDAAEFAKTLKSANVEWINLFGKCHHGMYYYDTKIGTRHPRLEADLLRGQIEGCRKEGIKCAIYTCVGWSEDTADRHPEWLELSADGVAGVKKPFSADYSAWRKLCLNNREYRQYIKAELKEEYDLFKPDGFWIDIISQSGCVCKTCMAGMLETGLDPARAEDVYKYGRIVQIGFMRDIYDYIKAFAHEVQIYFNCNPYEMDTADDAALAGRNKQGLNTYIDIESLPSDAWGYSHFPVAINYVNRHGKDINMMNGKFHTSWGDFGSLRNMAALEYECFRAIANGAGVCVGDQLHPCGMLDPSVYKRIGEVFASVKEKEPWCTNTKKLAQVGVYAARASGEPPVRDGGGRSELAAEGAYRMLTELKYGFDFIDFTDDISGYELVILPDCVSLTGEAAGRINAYVRGGGKVLVTAESAVSRLAGADVGADAGTGAPPAFMIDGIGVEYRGPAEYNPRYMRIAEDSFPGVPPMDYVTYERGADVVALEGTQVLAPVINPYFNRGYIKFCSHRQTPPDSSKVTEYAAVTLNGGIAYIANPLFYDYASSRCMVYRDIVGRLMLDLGVAPYVCADLPSFVEATLRKKEGGALILHLLNYIIERKCHRLDTIEETIPLFNRAIRVRAQAAPSRVTLVPSMKKLAFNWDGRYVSFTLDEIRGHEIVEIS